MLLERSARHQHERKRVLTRCRRGKQSKQRNTWALFVNAACEKEDPIVIGRYVRHRCFASLTNNKRPYGCWYYSNSKAWMTTDVIKEVLEKLNAKLKRKERKILLLMDNASCHPHNLAETFSNISLRTQLSSRSLLMLVLLPTGKLSTKRNFYALCSPE